MKVLIIPDIHLKPWMFERATEIMKSGTADKTVCIVKRRLAILEDMLSDKRQLAYVHRIDNVVFCHGGLTDYFRQAYWNAGVFNC